MDIYPGMPLPFPSTYDFIVHIQRAGHGTTKKYEIKKCNASKKNTLPVIGPMGESDQAYNVTAIRPPAHVMIGLGLALYEDDHRLWYSRGDAAIAGMGR
jgi:hypothetical protein